MKHTIYMFIATFSNRVSLLSLLYFMLLLIKFIMYYDFHKPFTYHALFAQSLYVKFIVSSQHLSFHFGKHFFSEDSLNVSNKSFALNICIDDENVINSAV